MEHLQYPIGKFKNPTMKPFNENLFIQLTDSNNVAEEASLQIIKGVQQRWVTVLKDMSEADFARTFFHSEHQASQDLFSVLGYCAWHTQHHLAHFKIIQAQ